MGAAAASTSSYVALLRGINVGGKNPVPMRELVALFDALGCRDVRTYIQSGNAVFTAKPALAAGLPARFARAFGKRFGFDSPLVLRSAGELAKVAANNPFLAAGEDVARLHVAFLADAPSKAQLAALDPQRSPPDRFVAAGRELYLCCPNGMARTKLTNAYFDGKLGTVSTVRNWRTVLELTKMASAKD